MPYRHAAPGEQCANCNDPAARIVGTQPQCLDHLTALLEHCRLAIARRHMTPPDNPAAYPAWADRLKQAIADDELTVDQAMTAWETARNTAA